MIRACASSSAPCLTRYRFVEAADGAEALALAREDRPDLVVLDVMLPGLSGIEVLEELRTDSGLSSIPVVVITAWSHAELDSTSPRSSCSRS